MPRKTTNIFERFQESLKAFTESTEASSSSDTNVLKSAFQSSSSSTAGSSDEAVIPVEGALSMSDTDGVQRRRRKTKRQVLESRSVDIEQVEC